MSPRYDSSMDTPPDTEPPRPIAHAQVLHRVDKVMHHVERVAQASAQIADALSPLRDLPGILEHNNCAEVRVLKTQMERFERDSENQNARIEAQGARFEAQFEKQNARIAAQFDAQNAKLDSQNAKLDTIAQGLTGWRWVSGVVPPLVIGILSTVLSTLLLQKLTH